MMFVKKLILTYCSWDKRSRGFTINELIIAISVLVFGIIVVYGAFYNIFNSTRNISPKFVAAYLGQEGLEIIRNIRDNNIINGESFDAGLVSGPCAIGCQLDYKTQSYSGLSSYDDSFLGQNSDHFYSYDIGATPTVFRRKIVVSQVSAAIIKVDVYIYWSYQNQPLTFAMSEYLYNHY